MSRDFMHAGEIKEIVREAYTAIDSSTEAVAWCLLEEEFALVPRSAIHRALGVGNHLRVAEIAPGETILDLGCGAGSTRSLLQFDRSVRTRDRARLPARDARADGRGSGRAGLSNVETLEAEMEAIPLPDRSVDHVISNGVINLAPASGACSRSARAFVPGGKLSVSDLTVGDEELPPEILTHRPRGPAEGRRADGA